VFISFRDRLSRFGFDYFKNLFAKYNTEIKVLDEFEETNKTFQEELTEDLIAIIHHFSMKLYSNRRMKFKEIESILNSDC
jgi:predicted site-specific integrase-resolvase